MSKLQFKYLIVEDTENRFVGEGRQVVIEIDIGNKSPIDPINIRNAKRIADKKIINREYE